MSETAGPDIANRRTAVGARRPFYRRKKSCPFSGPQAPKIDHKDVRLLSRSLRKRDRRRTSLWSIFGACGPENGQDFLRR